MRRKKDKRKQEREAKRLYPKRMDDESLTLSGGGRAEAKRGGAASSACAEASGAGNEAEGDPGHQR